MSEVNLVISLTNFIRHVQVLEDEKENVQRMLKNGE